jgi:hypothetical protein
MINMNAFEKIGLLIFSVGFYLTHKYFKNMLNIMRMLSKWFLVMMYGDIMLPVEYGVLHNVELKKSGSF